jgi:hypothetical protein
MKYFLSCFTLILLYPALSQKSETTSYLQKILIALSADSMEGRLVGSYGELKTAVFLSNELLKIGVKPYQDSYAKPFTYLYSPNLHDSTDTAKQQINSQNIVGFIDNHQQRTIVIGAHYDHIGRNEHKNSSFANSTGQIHNGADDNASGVAAVLTLAKHLQTNKSLEPVNYLIAFFSGEEDGLVGSKALVEQLMNDSLAIAAMINLDMVGRLDSLNHLYIGGIGSSPRLGEIIQTANHYDFEIVSESSGIGPSDHTSFYLKNIPVLFLFTGTHSDYHKPSDDSEKINFDGLTKIQAYLNDLLKELSNSAELPFTATKNTSKAKPQYKVTLGIMPSYVANEQGLQVDGVIDGKLAQKAGIQAGDVLIQLNDCKITDIYSYMDCLASLKTGEELRIKFIRNEKLNEAIVSVPEI